jgi:peroxiredoxin
MKKILLPLILLTISSYLVAQEAPEGLFINSKAYAFKAKDQNGNEVSLRDLLKKGKVVVVFYRGQWCPHCNKYLQRLEDSLSFIKEKGATLVAITPELPENVTKTIEKTKAEYSILYDEDLKIMKAYEVEYLVPENTLSRYRNTGIKLEENNGIKNGNYLPIPATYIINKDQMITYRHFDSDYRKRPSVKEILKNLE